MAIKKTEKKSKQTTRKVEKEDFLIVGIGASAGGLEALEQFFGNMPKPQHRIGQTTG